MDKTGDKSSGACRSKFFFLYKYMCECVCNTADGTCICYRSRLLYKSGKRRKLFGIHSTHTHTHKHTLVKVCFFSFLNAFTWLFYLYTKINKFFIR